MTSSIAVRGATRRFGDHLALDHVDLEVPAGSLAAVVGPSGSGKSTLIRSIAGIETLDAGSVVLDGVDVTARPPERRSATLVPQDGALFPHLDVAANVAYGVRGSRRVRAARAQEMLELVELDGLGRRRPHELSGGQQQRVALARALAVAPAVVLLDEPFSALDAHLRADVRRATAAAVRAAGATAVLVTHDQEEAISWASHLVVMVDGRVIDSGHPHAVYAHPRSATSAAFLGHANLVEGRCRDGRVATALGTLHVDAPDGDVTVLVRPEQLVADAAHGVRATVVETQYFGHDFLSTVVLEREDRLLLRGIGRPPAVGSTLTIAAAAETFPAVRRPATG